MNLRQLLSRGQLDSQWSEWENSADSTPPSHVRVQIKFSSGTILTGVTARLEEWNGKHGKENRATKWCTVALCKLPNGDEQVIRFGYPFADSETEWRSFNEDSKG